MIPRKFRLSRTNFPIFSEKRTIKRGTVLQFASYKKSNKQTNDQFSVVVSKRFGGAVKRNALKRLVYNELAKQLNNSNQDQWGRVVITPIGGIKDIDRKATESDIKGYFENSK